MNRSHAWSSIPLICALVLTVGCGGPRQVHEEWQPGIPKRQGLEVSGKQQGEWTYYDQQGHLEARGWWADDLQQGPWTFVFPDGAMRSQGEYVRGLRTGIWRQFHPGGIEAAAGSYDHDRQTGLWRYTWPDGRPYASGWFAAGVRGGWWERATTEGAPSDGGLWYLGLKVGPQITWRGGVSTLTDAGAPVGLTAESHTTAETSVWVLKDAGREVLAFAHHGGSPRLLRARIDGRTALARWDDQGHLVAAGERDARGRWGLWRTWDGSGKLIGSATYLADQPVLAATATAAASAANVPSIPTDLLAEERQRQALAPVEEAAAALAAAERLVLDAPADPPPKPAPTIPDEQQTSMTLVAGEAAQAPVPATAQQVEMTMPAAGPVALSPVDVLPRLWTGAQERKAATWIERYRHRQDEGLDDGYGNTIQTTSASNGNAPALLGRTLPQQRFLNSDGSVYDLSDHRGRPVVLVIMRGFSGQVCLYCATQTAALSDDIGRFRTLGADVIVVYPGPAESVPAFVAAVQSLRRDPPPMPLCLDVSLGLVRGLGIEGNLAKPTSLVLDGQGVVRYAYIGRNITDRPTVDDLIAAATRATR